VKIDALVEHILIQVHHQRIFARWLSFEPLARDLAKSRSTIPLAALLSQPDPNGQAARLQDVPRSAVRVCGETRCVEPSQSHRFAAAMTTFEHTVYGGATTGSYRSTAARHAARCRGSPATTLLHVVPIVHQCDQMSTRTIETTPEIESAVIRADSVLQSSYCDSRSDRNS
jgi:hypothetical protein